MKLPPNIELAILATGAFRVRAAVAEPIPPEVAEEYEVWLRAGCHASMTYLEHHAPLRRDFDALLEGTRTVISIAYNFYPSHLRDAHLPGVAMYAYGRDYHNVIRKRLRPVARMLEEAGGKARICIDSAPVAERYHACKSGLGYRGINGAVIIPGAGSCFFLAEILTTLAIPLLPSEPLPGSCMQCGACMKACPGGAIRGDGTIDARCCISYLTIEHQGEFCAEEKEILARGGCPALGCDICLRVCPHNATHPATQIAEFAPSQAVESLQMIKEDNMSAKEFEALSAGTPLRRAGYSNLLRNMKG